MLTLKIAIGIVQLIQVITNSVMQIIMSQHLKFLKLSNLSIPSKKYAAVYN